MRVKILLVILLFALPLLAQKKPIRPIAKLTYTGYYSFILNISAGAIEISQSPTPKYPNAQCLFAVGKTNANRDWIFKIRDTLISYHNRSTFIPYEFSRKAHEGNYHKTFDYVWDYDAGVVYGDVHKIGKYRRKDTVQLRPKTYDMLSVVWFVRELDFDSYNKNDLIPIRILIDNKIYDLHVRYLGRETIKTSAGKSECYVFSPLLVEGDVFKGGENMKIWVSCDENRLPMMMEAKILVGAVKAVLDSWKMAE